MCITYKANFANSAAANGWIERADTILESLERSSIHGYAWLARAYRSADLAAAAALTERALALAEEVGDTGLELVARSQLGLVKVCTGNTQAGFALIDGAVAAALARERTTLDTVVYTCCDMLTACEQAHDLERAAQWCLVADEFAETYGGHRRAGASS